MELKCIIVEDEPPALKKIEGFVKKLNYLNLSGSFDNAIDALNYLKVNTVDLVFLDIQMEEFSGIQFLETLKTRPQVIITSAYEAYAIKGYEYAVADYLLKPFTFQRFMQAVEKAFNTFANTERTKEYFFVKT